MVTVQQYYCWMAKASHTTGICGSLLPGGENLSLPVKVIELYELWVHLYQ